VAGRNVAFVQTIPGRCALSVNDAGLPAPKGWAWVRLGDIARLESGHTPSRNHPEYWDGDIAWIGIKDAREHHGGIINDTSQHVTQAGLDNSAARLLPADTVCLSRTASVGYVVIMGRPMATSQDFVNWVCSPAIEPAYLKWILLAEGDEGLRKFGKGTTHTTIYFPEVQAFHACVAPLNEQRRIVAKLDAVFAQTRAAKARLERLPALIEKLKRSILAAAFRGDLTADWRAASPDVEPAATLFQQYDPAPSGTCANSSTAAEQPDIPTTWRCVPLEALVTEGPTNGYSPPAGEHATGTSSLRLSATTQGRLILNEETIKRLHEIVPATSKHWLQPGDLLIQRANSLEYVGMAVIFDGPPDRFVYPDLMMRVRTPHRAVGEWLKHALTLARLNGYFARRATGTAGNMPKINGSVVRSVPIAVPPLDELALAVSRLSDALAATEAVEPRLRRALKHADALEQAALAKAFRGELVAQDPADEPAEVLLERIRAAKADEAPVVRRPRAAAATTYAAPPVTLAQAAESGPLFKHALDRQARAAAEPAALDLVVAALQQSDGRLTAAAIAQATGLDPAAIRAPLKELVAAGQVRTHGKARGTTYEWTA